MFERFTERARRVIILAREEAGRFRHDFVGTEHILLGLIHEGEGVAAKALESLGRAQGESVGQSAFEIYKDHPDIVANLRRALVGHPRLILADEPTGNLDPKTSEVIWDLFVQLQASLGVAFVIATHNHELARKADRGYRLVDGRAVSWP